MATVPPPSSSPAIQYNSQRSLRSFLSKIPWKNQVYKTPSIIKTCQRLPQKLRTSQLQSIGITDEEGDKIRRLQNGSDVRGVALEGEPGRTVDLTPQVAQAIAESFGEWVTEKVVSKNGGGDVAAGKRVHVSVGRDPRLSGPRLGAAIFSGLAKAGCEVIDMGLATTPACFMSTVLSLFNYDASIMMTASHLPYTRNGLKFFTKEGGLRSSEVEEICERAARKYVARKFGIGVGSGMPPSVKRVDFMSAYAAHLRNIIIERIAHPTNYETPLTDFKIIVNAGNGSAGFFTWAVLDKLGADTTGSLHLDPNGMFPNHTPNPEDSKAMAMTREAVLTNGADLGVVFDTDVDRSGVVDCTGVAINGDRLIALMSAIVLREHPGTTIVTDARASVGLTEFITAQGGHHCLYRVGYRNVIDKGVHLNKDGVETHLMMETTGHGALKENYFLDDGAYMVVKIIIEMVKMRLMGSNEGIGSLIKDLKEPAESVELRLNIITQPKYAKEKGSETVQTLKQYIQEGKLKGWELDTCGDCWVSEGCLVDTNEDPADIDAYMYRAKVSDEKNVQHGWIHIRQSVHNPNIALNMQSSIQGGCKSMTRDLLDSFLLASGLKEFLDISQVEKFAKM
ncbi:hypothetical protein LUZ60_012700 [Juncus effusus]|nr:hypothetical protein LUZ60_012700 [Juncus effusus]